MITDRSWVKRYARAHLAFIHDIEAIVEDIVEDCEGPSRDPRQPPMICIPMQPGMIMPMQAGMYLASGMPIQSPMGTLLNPIFHGSV